MRIGAFVNKRAEPATIARMAEFGYRLLERKSGAGGVLTLVFGP